MALGAVSGGMGVYKRTEGGAALEEVARNSNAVARTSLVMRQLWRKVHSTLCPENTGYRFDCQSTYSRRITVSCSKILPFCGHCILRLDLHIAGLRPVCVFFNINVRIYFPLSALLRP